MDRRLHQVVKSAELGPFDQIRLLEVGCGNGSNLLRFLRWGFAPEHLVGIELLEARHAEAARRLPAAVRLLLDDATTALPDEEFDVVYQSTVLSSMLDDSYQQRLARAMWDRTRSGGIIISYDFAFDNPHNSDVRKVPPSRLRALFPDSTMEISRLTLAPPIARQLSGRSWLHRSLYAIPFLRTHRLAVIHKN